MSEKPLMNRPRALSLGQAVKACSRADTGARVLVVPKLLFELLERAMQLDAGAGSRGLVFCKACDMAGTAAQVKEGPNGLRLLLEACVLAECIHLCVQVQAEGYRKAGVCSIPAAD